MSSSEKVEDEPLSRQEIEMEQMAQELLNLDMYEDGMTYDQMKDILSAIGESKEMAVQETENRASQESDQYSPELMPAEERRSLPRSKVRENARTPQPSFSYRQMNVSSPASSSKTLQPTLTPEDPATSPDMFDSTPQISYRNALMDNNTSFNKLLNESPGRSVPAKNKSRPASSNSVILQSDSSQGSQSAEIRVEVPSKHNQKLERWRLNPLDVSIEENDVPLRQPHRPSLNERPPFSLCQTERALEWSNKVMLSLRYHLEEVADLWREQRRSDVVDIQWGSPIKVGTANGSLDRKPATPHKNIPAKRGRTDANIPERANKRRAATITNQYIEESDSSDEGGTVKKTKKAPNTTGAAKRILTRKDKIMISLKGPTIEKPMLFSDRESDDDFGNENLFSLRKKTKERTAVKSPTPEYPRRIVPPSNPKSTRGRGGRKNRGGRGGKKRENQKPQTEVKAANLSESDDNPIFEHVMNDSTTKGRSERLEDSAIAMELEKEEDESKEAVIRPMPMKGLPARLKLQTQRLKETTQIEEREKRMKIEEQKKKEEEERKQKEQVAKDRLQREEEKAKIEEQRERAVKEREETWKRNGEKREMLRRMQERTKREGENEKRLLRDRDDVELVHETNLIKSSAENSVSCPICTKSFRSQDIQNHAAQCEQYDSIDDRPSSRASSHHSDDVIFTEDLPHQEKEYQCLVCYSFRTNNGITYEEHVNTCANRQRDRDSALAASVSASVNSAIVNVPTSPIRAFIPISRQVGCEINYQAQFSNKSEPKDSSRGKRSKNKRG